MELTVEFAARSDDAAIRALLRRQLMPGRIQLAFHREPDFSLGCAVTGDDYRIVVARAPEEIVGVACRSARRVFINGREQRIGYLGQLRVDERFRGRWLVARGFSLLARIDRDDPLPAYLASIVDGNDEASGILVRKRRASFPSFHEVAAYRTLAISVKKRRVEDSEDIMAGSVDQLSELVEFLRIDGSRRQFFPAWTEESLRSLGAFGLPLENIRIARRDGAIAGVIALWDQSAYKQAVVRGYSGWMKAVSWMLPRVGDEVRSAYAAMICVANDDTAVFARLLREIYNLAGARGFDYLLVGLDARDPLLPAARAYSHFLYPSRLYLASWSNGGHLYEQLDQRPVYVDIATL
jgi:hypothetical protein